MTLELARSGIENTWANFGLKSRQSQFPNLDWCLQGILVHTIPKTERLDKIARRDFFSTTPFEWHYNSTTSKWCESNARGDIDKPNLRVRTC